MTTSVRSFAKINLGLYIGAPRADGFHDLRTIYQTIALHEVIRVSVERGSGIEILCEDARVPTNSSNTCYQIAKRVMAELRAKGRVTIEIEKRLPVQGGLGAASSNAVATMIALERAVKQPLGGAARLRIAAEVGSDLPLFVLGGTVLGIGRGEEVYPLPDWPAINLVVVMPEVGVSTPQAFAKWDELVASQGVTGLRPARTPRLDSGQTGEEARPFTGSTWTGEDAHLSTSSTERAGMPVSTLPDADRELTWWGASDRLREVGRVLSAWLGTLNTGAPAKGGSRAGSLLLDLVRTGIENDFERVVFPQHPELRDIKRALERAGARYASLSGSGSAVYGLFRSRAEAAKAASLLRRRGWTATATTTLTRRQYWKQFVVSGC